MVIVYLLIKTPFSCVHSSTVAQSCQKGGSDLLVLPNSLERLQHVRSANRGRVLLRSPDLEQFGSHHIG